MLREKLHLEWMDSVKRALGAREMSVEQEKMVVHDQI